MPELHDLAFFQPHLNTTFSAEDGDTSVALELIEAKEIGSEASQREDARTPFSLLFRGPAGTTLGQRTFTLSHDKVGQLEIFLVPIQPDDEGPLFEAVFN